MKEELYGKLKEVEFIPFEIENLSKKQLINKEIFEYINTVEDVVEREQIIIKLEERAKELGCLSSFRKILKQYIKDSTRLTKLTHNEIAEMLLQENSLAIYENNLYIYVDGIYKLDIKSIERKIIEIVPNANSHLREEVCKYLELKNDIYMQQNKESNIINFKNGLYNLKEKKMYAHTPNFFSINQINVNYKENARVVTEVDDFLNKISNYNIQRKQTILEMIGYSMTTSMKFQKAFILYGETARNGKSTLLTVITKLIGEENVGNVSLRDISTNRFAGSGIQGKILNTCSEMTEEILKDISFFKALIGGDNVEVEKKFKDRKTISQYAKFIFCANALPHVADKTNGFYRRLHIIPFERSFTDEEVKDFDIDKILTNDALEYLAKISLDAYMKMNGTFSNYEESEKEVNKYKMKSNSILAFINDAPNIKLIYERNIFPKAQTIYDCYVKYCQYNGLKAVGRNTFYDEIEKSEKVTVKNHNHQKYYIFKL